MSRKNCWACTASHLSCNSDGGDYVSCGFCGHNLNPKHEVSEAEHKGYEFTYDWLEFYRQCWYYCAKCKRIFKRGCCHWDGGCSDQSYFIKVCASYTLDGEQHDGEPVFDTFKDFTHNFDRYSFKTICTCQNQENQNLKPREDKKCCKVISQCHSLIDTIDYENHELARPLQFKAPKDDPNLFGVRYGDGKFVVVRAKNLEHAREVLADDCEIYCLKIKDLTSMTKGMNSYEIWNNMKEKFEFPPDSDE